MFKHATMNRAFKLVWNQARGAYVAVAETARGHAVSTSSTRIARALLVASGVAAGAAVQAQVRPATTVLPTGGNTNAYISGNGVPIVNIATPNAQGLSHNKYTRYDVEANGLVLNNGNTSQAARQSQLAGQVVGNTNLNKEATTILNEVVSNRRSVLAGFTEVLGGKADVIVANPYGITCSGCGFINTDRVTLTTGTPNISLDGRLAGFSVSSGDVLINGVGLNATAQQMLDIVTRSLVVHGQINTAAGGSLGITAGLNQWSYDTRAVTGSTTATDAKPTLAVDSSALGGMYAGRIRLISTEAGVGVRMLGDAAAKVDDFSISSVGQVDIRSGIAAERDLQVGSSALSLSDARLSARRDLSLSATGAATFSGSSLLANRALGVSVGSLSDTASSTTFADNNTRFGQTLSLTVGQQASFSGVSWGTEGAFTGQFGSLVVEADAGAMFYAGSNLSLSTLGHLALSTAAVQAKGALSLSATQGQISTEAAEGQGLQSTQGDVSLSAGQGLRLDGTTTADAGAVSLRAQGPMSLGGTVHAKGNIDISDLQGGASQDLSNSGTVLAEGRLSVAAKVLRNEEGAGLQGSQGTRITAQSFTNDGTLVMSTDAAADGQLNLGQLSNSGVIQSQRDLSLTLLSSLSNSGTVLAVRDLSVQASSASQALALNNTEDGILQAGRTLSLGSSTRRLVIDTQSGAVIGGSALNVWATRLNNSGFLQTDGDMGLNSTDALSNSGSVIAAGALTLSATTATNTGKLQSGDALSLTANTLSNSGVINAAQNDEQDITLSVGSLNNQATGVIQASQHLNIKVATQLDNAGALLALGGDLNIQASEGSTGGQVINRAEASMVAGGRLIVGQASARTLAFDTQAGTLAGQAIDLQVQSLNNAGEVQADTTLGITASGALTNTGTLLAGSNLSARVGATLDNSGSLLAQGDMALLVLDNTRATPLSVTNHGDGLMQANGTFTVGTTNEHRLNFTQGAALLANRIEIKGTGVRNSGWTQATTTFTALNLSSLENEATGTLLANGTMALGAGTLGNSGTIQAQDGMSLTAGTLVNRGNIIMSTPRAEGVELDATAISGHIVVGSLKNDAEGLIQSAGHLDITARESVANQGGATILAAGDLKITAQVADVDITLTNAMGSVLQAGGTLSIEGTAVDGVSGHNIQLLDQSGQMLGKSVAITAQGLINQGKIQSDEAMSVNLLGTLENQGDLLAMGTLGLKATRVDNSGAMQASAGLSLDAEQLLNSGTLVTAVGVHDSRISVDVFSNASEGVIQSLGGDGISTLAVNVGSEFTNTGRLIAESNLGIQNSAASGTLQVDNQGLIQAGRLLRVGTSSQIDLFNEEGAKVIGQDNQIKAGSVRNDGAIGGGGIKINSVGLHNAGLISAATALNITTNDLGNTADGVIQNATLASAVGSIQAVSIVNAGTINLGRSTEWGSISSEWLTNQAGGVIDSRSVQMNLNVGVKLDNSGNIHSNGRLEIDASSTLQTLDIQNHATGVIEAGADLRLGLLDNANLGKVSVQDGQMLAGAQLDFRLKSLVNGGVIQAGAPQATTASSIALEEGLSNLQGARLTLSTGDNAVTYVGGPKVPHQIIATTITNAGAIESGGDVLVYRHTNDVFTNSGSIVMDGGLHFITSGDGANEAADQYTLDNTGRIDIGGKLSLLGLKGLTIKTGSTWVAGELDAKAPTTSIQDKAMLNTLGSLSLITNSLSLATSTSRIVAATSGTGTATITLTSAFSNPGAIHSGDKLLFTAPSITNTSTGGMSALGDMKLLATTSVINSGAIYAGNDLWVQTLDASNGVVTNSALTGTIDVGRDAMLISAHLSNHNSIDAGRDITLDSATLKNEISGSIKPTVTAADTLTIKGFNTALNKGGLLAADTINLVGLSGGSPTFTNDPAGNTGAGVYANTLNANGLAVVNQGSPDAPKVDKKTQTGFARFKLSNPLTGSGSAGVSDAAEGGATTVGLSAVGKTVGKSATKSLPTQSVQGTGAGSDALAQANKAAGVTGTKTATGAPAIGFPGLTIALPANPNGYFVLNKDPQAQFLVETNPLFNVGQNFVGSNYLAQRYGYNPDVVVKRLGDSNYEANLIKQQLVSKTGNNLLKGFRNEAAQVQGLMDNALAQGKALGLSYGAAPTAEQLKKLTADIVWMVETVVDGQHVLAPVVYLAESTRNGIAQGGVIAGNDVTMNVSSLSNTGGTISGANTLDITSKGDVTNTGGTIKGGAVSVVSTEGSIVNRTTSRTVETSNGTRTEIGKTATIEATQSLNLDAKKDITNIGAQVKSAGDARLNAGNNITFDTIEDKTTSTDTTTTKSKGRKTTETTSTTTVNQVKSGLSVGGNLGAKAGNDLTLAGTDVTVGGNAALVAGKNVNLVARENRSESTTSTSSKGTGTFGSLKSSSSSTSSTQQTRNVGTTLNVGGNAAVVAGQTATVQGSSVKAGGNVVVKASDVKILAGQDTDTSSSTSKSSKKGLSTSGSGVSFSQSTTTTTNTNRSTSVGSSIQAGGSVGLSADNKVTVQGSSVKATKDVVVSATTVEVLAARNVDTSTTSTSKTSTGLYFDSTNGASASGDKSGSKRQGAQGSAQASAGLSSQNNLDLVRQSTTTTSTTDVTHTGSQLGAGGVLIVQAKDKLTVQGSDLSGDQGAMVKGKNVEFLAAQDSHTSTTTNTTRSAGLYADAKAHAEGSAQAGVGSQGNGAQAKGEADAKASAGVQVRQSSETTTSGTTTARVSTITSKSGDVIRQADERLLDVGTAIEAGGQLVQKATTIDSQAARNTSFSTTETSSSSARAGAFVGGDAKTNNGAYASNGGDAKAQAQQAGTDYAKSGGTNGGGMGSQASGGRGVEVQLTQDQSRESSNSSTAVVSTIKTGGGVSSTSTGKTTMEGTRIEAGGNVDIAASELNFQAARNTQSSTSSSTDLAAGTEVGKGKSVTLSGSREAEQSRSDASQAVAGSIQSGGKVNVKTSGDTRLEGTNIKSSGDTTVSAGGNLSLVAARDERSSSASANSVGGEIELGKNKKGKTGAESGKLEGSISEANSSSSNAKGGAIESGGSVKLSAGKTATLEGTDVTAQKGASVDASKVDLKAATSTQSSDSFSAEASASAEKGKSGGKKGDSKPSKSDKGSDGKGGQSVVGGEFSSSQSSGSQQKGVNVSGGEGGFKVNGQATDAPAVGDKATNPASPEAEVAKASAKKPKKKSTVKKAETSVGTPSPKAP